MKVTLREVLIPILIVLIIFAGMRFSLQGFGINGPSMLPDFHNGQDWLVNKLSYHFHDPQRGDVIVFHYPRNPKLLYIKRVIGLPGDHVKITENGKIYINDYLLKEKPDRGLTDQIGSFCDVYLEKGEYFVLGDNRSSNTDPPYSSSDSRDWGPVPRKNIVGKTWLCYWPPSEWRFSPSYSWELSPSDSATME